MQVKVIGDRLQPANGPHVFCDYQIEATKELWNPDLVEMARSMGARGLRLRRRSEVYGAITEALRSPGPVVVDAEMDIGSKVYNPTAFAYASDFAQRGLERPPF